MLTGQRVEEIARLHIDQWDAKERIIDWSTTKNGKPHAIPVPEVAAELIESIKPNAHGWFFPSATDPTKPVSHGTLYSFMWRQREREVIPVVTNRDLRRTWKTLAGKACACRNSNSHVQMMKSAEKWRRQNATNGMYCSRRWRVLVGRKVRASLVIQQRLRTPTGPFFARCFIGIILGLVAEFAFMRVSTRLMMSNPGIVRRANEAQ